MQCLYCGGYGARLYRWVWLGADGWDYWAQMCEECARQEWERHQEAVDRGLASDFWHLVRY